MRNFIRLKHLFMANVRTAAPTKCISLCAVAKAQKQTLSLSNAKRIRPGHFRDVVGVQSLFLRNLSQQARSNKIRICDADQMVYFGSRKEDQLRLYEVVKHLFLC